MHVYVAGPFTGDELSNIRGALNVAEKLRQVGAYPFVPHAHYAMWHLVHPGEYEQWMAECLAWVERCDAIYRLPGDSPGADRELACAIEHGKRVFTDIADVERAIAAQ